MRHMVPTDATYFYMTDQRGTDRTMPATAPASTTTSSGGAWRFVSASQPKR